MGLPVGSQGFIAIGLSGILHVALKLEARRSSDADQANSAAPASVNHT